MAVEFQLVAHENDIVAVKVLNIFKSLDEKIRTKTLKEGQVALPGQTAIISSECLYYFRAKEVISHSVIHPMDIPSWAKEATGFMVFRNGSKVKIREVCSRHLQQLKQDEVDESSRGRAIVLFPTNVGCKKDYGSFVQDPVLSGIHEAL